MATIYELWKTSFEKYNFGPILLLPGIKSHSLRSAITDLRALLLEVPLINLKSHFHLITVRLRSDRGATLRRLRVTRKEPCHRNRRPSSGERFHPSHQDRFLNEGLFHPSLQRIGRGIVSRLWAHLVVCDIEDVRNRFRLLDTDIIGHILPFRLFANINTSINIESKVKRFQTYAILFLYSFTLCI